MSKIDNHHKNPCAICGHRNLHGEVNGCVANIAALGEPAAWCPCRTYVAAQAPTRDRVADQATGIRLGQEGADAALHGYAMNDGTWRAAAETRLAELIDTGVVFTSEDVIDKVGPAPSPNAIGGLFNSWKSRMVQVGFTTATRKEAHGRALRQWQGKAA